MASGDPGAMGSDAMWSARGGSMPAMELTLERYPQNAGETASGWNHTVPT